MRLEKIKLTNFRCFGENEETIHISHLTTFIGNNSTGKTAALSALNYLFSENQADRILKQSDFHVSKSNFSENKSVSLAIEAVFTFEELNSEGISEGKAVPEFFEEMTVKENGICCLRVRLEATWERSSLPEGSIDSSIYFITCPEGETNVESYRKPAPRRLLDRIRIIYVPAMREPGKQLKNVSGTMMYRILHYVRWNEEIQGNINEKIKELNTLCASVEDVQTVKEAMLHQWERYGSDERYQKSDIHFHSTDLESLLKRSEIVFSSEDTSEVEYKIEELGDGLRSLFYISMVGSLLATEKAIVSSGSSPEIILPVLTIITLEEPENHIAPHLLGKLVQNLQKITQDEDAQVILSSHSPAIIKRISPEDLRYFRMESKFRTTTVKTIPLPNSETLADQYKYVKEAVKAYPEIYFAKLVILGEGDSEEIILPRFFEAKSKNLDASGISIVPLGGRHVNHFWRLLEDLEIPYITLLDLDLGRTGGGWGRIKYVFDQLIKNHKNQKGVLHSTIAEEELKQMHMWTFNSDCMLRGIEYLEKFNVFFSVPLDIDFLMLSMYPKEYKAILKNGEGPRIGSMRIADMKDLAYDEKYKERVACDVRNTLKCCNKTEECCQEAEKWYTDEQKELMVWYNYFFLNRGKPSTHFEVLASTDFNTVPEVFERLIDRAENLLKNGNE